jgi:hypothetical protein
MRLIPPIIANLALLVSALGFGSLLRGLMPAAFSRLDRLSLALLGGLGIVGGLLFLAGQTWFTRPSMLLILLPGIVLGLRFLARELAETGARMPNIGGSALPGIIVAFVLLVTAVAGLAEPVGDIRMDAIAYHLLGPKVWLRNALIRPVLDESLTAFPATVETQFAALMAFGGQRAPGFYAVIALVALLLLTLALARRTGLNAREAWWAAALICAMPVVYRGAFGGFVDVIYSSFLLAAARIAFDAQRPRHYLLLGVFCGFALGTKYTGLIAVSLLVACTFFIAMRAHQQDKQTALLHLAIACAAAFLVAAPWYLRNWLLLGCPLYPPPPFLLRFFAVRYLPPEALQHLLTRIWKEGRGMGRSPLSILLLPWHLTYHPANFINGAGGIGLAPLALAPFGLIASRRDSFAKWLAIFAFLMTAAWFVSAQEARYLIHGYIVAAIFAVWGWKYVDRGSPRLGATLAKLVVACSILYGLFMIVSARLDDVHAATSQRFAEQRRKTEVPYVDSFDFLNREVSATKVLILEPSVPPYYLDKDYLKPLGRLGENVLPEANDLPKILSELDLLHISHILDVRVEAGQFRITQETPRLKLVFQRENQKIYRVE